MVTRMQVNPLVFVGLPPNVQFISRLGLPTDKIETMIYLVCEKLGLDQSLITSNRKREYVEARFIVVGLMLKANPKTTLVELGKKFKRDHSTMVYAREQFNALLSTDKGFKAKVDLVLKTSLV